LIKAVLFDLDDTLYDRVKAQGDILRIIVREYPELFSGLDHETILHAFYESDRLSTIEFYAGAPLDSSSRLRRTRMFLRLLSISEGRAGEIAATYMKAYSTVVTPVAGTERVFAELSGRYRLGIVSNGSPDVQYTKLKGLGIKDSLCCIVLSEEVGIRKPDPAIFSRACEALALRPQECLYVGDSYRNDVVGAKGAGVLACWFNPQRQTIPAGSSVVPDFAIGALDEVLDILDCA
jgi:putative hydrolase of the HAD superfamily